MALAIVIEKFEPTEDLAGYKKAFINNFRKNKIFRNINYLTKFRIQEPRSCKKHRTGHAKIPGSNPGGSFCL